MSESPRLDYQVGEVVLDLITQQHATIVETTPGPGGANRSMHFRLDDSIPETEDYDRWRNCYEIEKASKN